MDHSGRRRNEGRKKGWTDGVSKREREEGEWERHYRKTLRNSSFSICVLRNRRGTDDAE